MYILVRCLQNSQTKFVSSLFRTVFQQCLVKLIFNALKFAELLIISYTALTHGNLGGNR